MTKPTLRKGPAAEYEAPNEIIREFSQKPVALVSPQVARQSTGGLIALRTMEDGTLLVDLYRLDEGVKVNVPTANLNHTGDTVPVTLTPAELDYLARAVDLGRSDERASALLAPDERDTLLRKLGGRRNS